MSYREIPVNWLLDTAISLGKSMGLQQRVELSEHSIEIDMTNPEKQNRAWDTTLYSNGNVFVDGYANPVKPQVDHNPQLDTPDTVDVAEGDVADDDDAHVALISSSRYRDYMRQDLVSQLLTPQEQWKLIAYGVIGLGILQFVAIIVTMYGTEAF